jgi:hypothetical protein
VTGFKIDGHTIKRGTLLDNSHLVPLGVENYALHIGLVHIGEQAKIFINIILEMLTWL